MELNVNGDVSDVFYRYKMPVLQTKVEGYGGNGVKTVIPNIMSIGKSLNCPAIYLLKHFGYELGTQSRIDGTQRYILNGNHEKGKLQELLQKFINTYILCIRCKTPETVLKVLPKRCKLRASCAACGHAYAIDENSKLAAYIIKCHPKRHE